MRLNQYLTEMAQPREVDFAKKYFHGTSTDKAGKGILSKGISPPDLEFKKTHQLTPVKGKVYITANIRYAIVYAIRGDMVGYKLPESDFKKGEEYAWIFVINGKQLKDIQPDEDSVGEMISNKEPEWLYRLAQNELTPRQLRKVMEYEYAYWASCGKKLNKIMTDKQKLNLIDAGAHIAHTGNLKPDECWKMHKKDNEKLKRDGSNFFKIAKRVK